ncbi:MAG: glycosyltransferase [Nitratireductor sp.]|nr:glycosyltransferase [Nitratireductor sp.]
MNARFEKRRHLRRWVAVVYIASSLAYLAWRLTIFNEHAPLLSTMYFIADVIAVVLGCLAIFVSWHYRHRESPPAPEGLSVDVLVPVYKEPLEMVRRTIEGALAISYPHRTFLLDDGRRPELREMAAELGCGYLVRDDNRHAKAGNLNNALSQTNGDFIAVFDADHIPQPHALHATLGFFDDPKVGMVQAPQDYFNIDAMQYQNNARNGALWHDQSFFYNISQPGRDHYNAASCAGTSVVYRRSALQAIGGIPVETVTEDVHTSLKLHKAGYAAPYLNEPIAYGVAASDLADYYRTRLRYGHGNIHVLRRENILFCKGLTWRQRLSYLFLGLIYLEGWQQLLVFLVPSIALIFGIAPFDITIFNVLVVLVFPLWTYALMQEIGCGFSRYWTNEIFSMIRWPVHLLAATALFKDRVVWRSSTKNIKGRVDWALLAPQIAVIALSLGAIGLGVWRLMSDFSVGPLITVVADRLPSWDAIVARADLLWASTQEAVARLSGTAPEPVISISQVSGGSPVPVSPAAPPLFIAPEKEIDWFQPLTTGYTLDLIVVAGFWALMNALRGIFVVAKVVSNARNSREEYAFRCLVPVELQIGGETILTVADRLSSREIRFPEPVRRRLLAQKASLPALLHLPDARVKVAVQMPVSKGDHYFPLQAGEAERKIIARRLYAVNWHRDMIHHNAEFGTPLTALARLIGIRSKTEEGVAWQQAGLLAHGSGKQVSGANGQPVVLQSARRKGVADQLTAFRPLEPGTKVAVRTTDADTQTRQFVIAGEMPGNPDATSDAADPQCYRYKVVDVTPVRGRTRRVPSVADDQILPEMIIGQPARVRTADPRKTATLSESRKKTIAGKAPATAPLSDSR